LLNARDAIGVNSAGEITIHTQRQDSEVRALIADNGDGIAPENLDRIFDPFFSTKPKGQGTGLGLAVCHSLVTAHGGRISVKADDKGANFTISFPVSGQ
jgi:signal transduction histidine kinase